MTRPLSLLSPATDAVGDDLRASELPRTVIDPAASDYATDEALFYGFRRLAPSAGTPSAAEVGDYVHDPRHDDKIRAFIDGAHWIVTGAPGAGKTLLPKWLGHNMGLPVYQFNHSQHVQGDDLYGKMDQDAGGRWVHRDGALLTAYTRGGLYIGDEIGKLKSNIQDEYLPFLNGDRVVVRTAGGTRTVEPHPLFRFVGTTNGTRYGSNFDISDALEDRVIHWRLRYLEREVEIALLEREAPSVPPSIIANIVDFANAIRAAHEQNPDANRTFLSTRLLRKLMRYIERGYGTLDDAIETYIYERVRERRPEEVVALDRILAAHLTLDRFHAA